MEQIKVAMFSFADIDNYGDIMFSHVFKMEIESRIPKVIIDFLTPSEFETDGIQYMGYERERVDGKYDALILAGGEVVHLFEERTWRPIYQKNKQRVLSGNATDVVWDWADSSCNFKGWLSVGVRPFGDKWDKNKVDSVIENLDYISVRGIISKKILEGSNFEVFNPKINITPDLGWIFPKYLKFRNEVGKHIGKFVVSDTKYIIFQVHNITELEAVEIGKDLLQFQMETGFKVLLMPVIHLWKDETYLEMVSEAANGELLVLPNDLSIIEMLDLIVHTEVVLCSSLHVAITALANGVPAAIFNKWQGSKLQDLFGLQFRTNYLFSDFNETYNVLMELMKEKENSKSLLAYSHFMEEKLKETFDDLAAKIIESKK